MTIRFEAGTHCAVLRERAGACIEFIGLANDSKRESNTSGFISRLTLTMPSSLDLHRHRILDDRVTVPESALNLESIQIG